MRMHLLLYSGLLIALVSAHYARHGLIQTPASVVQDGRAMGTRVSLPLRLVLAS